MAQLGTQIQTANALMAQNAASQQATNQSSVFTGMLVQNNYTSGSMPTNIYISNTTTSTVPITMSVVNQTSVVNAYSCTPFESLATDALMKELEGNGVYLPDGSRLVLKDGKPVIRVRHDDGNESFFPVHKQHFGVIDLDPQVHDLAVGTVLRLPNGQCLKIDKDGGLTKETFIHARDRTINVSGGNATLYESLAFCHFRNIHIPRGCHAEAVFELPDGAKLILHADDRVEVDGANGKNLYRSHPTRDFNPYLNASDLLEDFITYCGSQNMSKREFSELPISLFIYWLIVKAAEADGDSTDEVLPMLTTAVEETKGHAHRCKDCGRFLTKRYEEHNIAFCNSQHMDRYLSKVA